MLNTVRVEKEVPRGDLYVALPADRTPAALVEDYWSVMDKAGRLGWRLGETPGNPRRAIEEMVWQYAPHVYFLLDPDPVRVVGEFTLANFSGAAAQVHFSVLPQQPLRQARAVARAMIDTVLQRWTDTRGGPFLKTLYGVLPAPHRSAIMFCLSCGFTRWGVFPAGTRYLGSVCDGVVLLKTREDT